jgi:hypothetical protein
MSNIPDNPTRNPPPKPGEAPQKTKEPQHGQDKGGQKQQPMQPKREDRPGQGDRID